MGSMKEVGDLLIASVRAYVGAAADGITKRIDELDARLNAIPAGPRGEKGEAGTPGADGAQGPQGVAGEPGKIGSPGEPGIAGKDGAPGVDGKDGAAGLPGEKGIDGAPGRDGRDGLPGVAGKDGASGVDGRAGFSLEDFEVALAEDGRTLKLSFQRGDLLIERSIRLATMIYRGVWREAEHEPGDVVTWGGSAWHCQEKTADKPGASASWKLMVKEGRPGERGKDAGAPPTAREPVRLR